MKRLNRRLVLVLVAVLLVVAPIVALAGGYKYYMRVSPDQVMYCWYDSSGWDTSDCDIVNG